MIKGLGTDIIEIERVKKAILRTASFKDKVFLDTEQLLFSTADGRFKMESLAGAFAAKEAVSKALGTGFRSFTPLEIEVTKDTYGKPSVLLHGNAKHLAHQLGIEKILLTIAHSKEYATATAIAEGRE